MNKLYILGALALANVEAYINFSTLTNGVYTTAGVLGSYGMGGTYTYTVSSDCYTTATATTLGLNNIYHQYYSFTMAKGTATWGTTSITTGLIITTLVSITNAYTGCYHSHLYNWMAQPQIAATTAQGGFGNNGVAYGYAMSGTAITSCASLSVVTTTLFKSSVFYGAQYQNAIGIHSAATGGTASTTIVPFWGRVGPAWYTAKIGTALSFITIIVSGLATTSAQNAYWDFMQTNVFQGMTQFGRGGGASTSPCGWWVVYTHENNGGQNNNVDAINVLNDDSTITVNMWTDNSVVKAASAFVLAALAGLLF